MADTLIALGGADGVWQELEQAQALCPDADIGAVNEAGRDYPGRLTLWATLHAEKFDMWQRGRKGNSDYISVANKGHALPRIDRIVKEEWSGTSGLFLVQAAILELGYDRVICCGMPIQDRPHYFDAANWGGETVYRRGWQKAATDPRMEGRFRSMSGFTSKLLGVPDEEWLAVPAKH